MGCAVRDCASDVARAVGAEAADRGDGQVAGGGQLGRHPQDGLARRLLRLHAPICLPSSDDFIHLGATCVTLGWGAKRERLIQHHLVLHIVIDLLHRTTIACGRT